MQTFSFGPAFSCCQRQRGSPRSRIREKEAAMDSASTFETDLGGEEVSVKKMVYDNKFGVPGTVVALTSR